MRTIYLDNNATTRPDDNVRQAVADALETWWANPSSVHRAGQAVRQRIELARESVAELLGCRDREVIFASGGTETANLAVRGCLDRWPDRRLVVSSRLEHSAVRETLERLAERGRIDVHWLGSTLDGIVDTDELDNVLRERAAETAVVSLMWANNETGAIAPVQRIGAICHDHGVAFHTDAVQAVGKLAVTLDGSIDLLSFSAHKLHGPKGIGGLYVRRGARVEPQITGGPHERQRRGGTENVPGILGMGVAASNALTFLADSDRILRIADLRDRFVARITDAIDDAVVNAADAPRLWNTANLGFPRLEAEAILLSLSERGVAASAGAACSSGSLDPSPVLLAMGIDPGTAHGSVRFSLSRETTEDEIEAAAGIVIDVVSRLKSLMPA